MIRGPLRALLGPIRRVVNNVERTGDPEVIKGINLKSDIENEQGCLLGLRGLLRGKREGGEIFRVFFSVI